MTTEAIVAETVATTVANPTKLALAGKAALAGAKYVGSAAVAGVVIGTGAGITVAVAVPVFMGTYNLVTWGMDKVKSKFENKKDDAAGLTPSPA